MGLNMYFPYFRGKQYDLITIRECAELMAQAGFVPIVEPVKEGLNGLRRSIDAITAANGKIILVVNPACGDHTTDPAALAQLVQVDLVEHANVSPGILLTEDTSIEDAIALCKQYANRAITLIHDGFMDPKGLSAALTELQAVSRHVFIDSTRSYRKHFLDGQRVLIKDGFERRANRKHPEYEIFSDLHVTFPDEDVDGFGDFLIVGDDFSESGGPAYAVAIHVTCIDDERDDEMYIHHFKSIRFETPADPAGKFAEALDKLATEVYSGASKILRTNAITEFLQLRDDGHFPGLGYVKKLSMNHHIETLAHYFKYAV